VGRDFEKMKAGEFIGKEFLHGRTIVGDFTTVRQPASPPPAGRELGRPNLPGLPLP